MDNDDQTRVRKAKWYPRRLAILIALVVLAGAGSAIAARRSGGLGQWFAGLFSSGSTGRVTPTESELGAPLDLFKPRPIGNAFDSPPRISYVQIVDLDRDGLPDVLVCDCVSNSISWIRQYPRGVFQERLIADQLPAPARLECVDFDEDGDLDLFAAVLGKLYPSNEKIGALVALENLGNAEFSRRMLLENVARVSDVRADDLDHDGDLDLVVTQFGYNEGQMQWLENVGDWQFEGHVLQSLAGGIHGAVGDMNQDSQTDIVLLVSQETEELYLFQGDGRGNFSESSIYAARNPDFGSSGAWLNDLDQDGDLDIVYTNGDAFDYSPPRPWPWHGVGWLENRGEEGYRYHRLVDFGGCVNAQVSDYDQDGDLDIFAASAFNDWETPESQSLILLENTGNMHFVEHALANLPTHIQALAIGDLNGDGHVDLVTGGMHISEPYDRVERIVYWEGIGNISSR